MLRLIKKDLLLYKNIIYALLYFYVAIEILVLISIIFQKISPWNFIDFIYFYKLEDPFYTLITLVTSVVNIVFCFMVFAKENFTFVLTFPNDRKQIFNTKMLVCGVFTIINIFFSLANIFMLMTFIELATIPKNINFQDHLLYSLLTFYAWLILILNIAINLPILNQFTKQFNVDKKILFFIPISIIYLLVIVMLFYFFTQVNVFEFNYQFRYIGLTLIMFGINFTLFHFSKKVFMRIEV